MEYTNLGLETTPERQVTEAKSDIGYNDLLELLGIVRGIMCQLDYVAMSENYVAKE